MSRKKSGDVKKAVKKQLRLHQEAIVILVAVFIIIAGALIYFHSSGTTATQSTELTPQQASEKLVDWLKNFFATKGINLDAKVLNVREESGVYRIRLILRANGQTQEVNYFITKDGKYLFPITLDLRKVPATQKSASMQGPPKSEKPKVELFVMSHCPFGVQMEKALIPVLRLLEDKVDFNLRFVNYAMHGKDEVWENVRQYCIQKLYGTEKLLDYLECYDYTGPSSSDVCMKNAGIDASKVNRCVRETDKEYNISNILKNKTVWLNGRFPPFPIDDNLNVKYGVRGSPTLVINGSVINAQRSPEALKQAICSAFTTPPEECNQILDNAPASPGFGNSSGATATSGQCS